MERIPSPSDQPDQENQAGTLPHMTPVPPSPPRSSMAPPRQPFPFPDDRPLDGEMLEAFFERLSDRDLTTREIQRFKERIKTLLEERDQLTTTVQASEAQLREKDAELVAFQQQWEEARRTISEGNGQQALSESPRKKVGMYSAAAALLLVLGGAGGRTFFRNEERPLDEASMTVPTPSAGETALPSAPEPEGPLSASEQEHETALSDLPAIDVKALVTRTVAENPEISELLQTVERGEPLSYYQIDRVRTFHELVIDRARQQLDRSIFRSRELLYAKKDQENAALEQLIDQRRAAFNKQADEIRALINALPHRR
ncbi:MAG: hypothetical protein AB7J40_03020 [Candidatus Altimarinota bacterium]